MKFYELSLFTGSERFRLQSELVHLVHQTQSIKINYLIQACQIHLEFLTMKEKGEKDVVRQQFLREHLRGNPFEVKVQILWNCELVLQIYKE